jgi:hypothetical protein
VTCIRERKGNNSHKAVRLSSAARHCVTRLALLLKSATLHHLIKKLATVCHECDTSARELCASNGRGADESPGLGDFRSVQPRASAAERGDELGNCLIAVAGVGRTIHVRIGDIPHPTHHEITEMCDTTSDFVCMVDVGPLRYRPDDKVKPCIRLPSTDCSCF